MAFKKVIRCSFHFTAMKMISTGFFLSSASPKNSCLTYFFHTILLTVVDLGVVTEILIILFGMSNQSQNSFVPLYKTHSCASELSKAVLDCVWFGINIFICCCSFVWNTKAIPFKKLVCWEKSMASK